eukprot:scaffold18187_cov109-Isochrysis_galbana.AAC.3
MACWGRVWAFGPVEAGMWARSGRLGQVGRPMLGQVGGCERLVRLLLKWSTRLGRSVEDLWGRSGHLGHVGAGWASRGTFREEHTISWAGASRFGASGRLGKDWVRWHQGRLRAGWAGWRRSIRVGAGTSGRLRAGCGRNVGVDWADSSLHREKWQAPLAGRKRRDGCQTSGWAPTLGCFGARGGSWWEEVSWAG